MTKSERKKNTKVLSRLDVIEFLTLLKTRNLHYIAEHFAISDRAAQYTKRKYGAYSDELIDEAIRNIERKIHLESVYPKRDYKAQDTCEHHHCTLFLKCSCSLTLGENDLDKAIEILQKKRDYLKSNRLVTITL
jgi:hypothetical protein